MASQGMDKDDGDLIALVRKLAAEGKTFSIALEPGEAAIVDKAKQSTHYFSVERSIGDCIQWVYVPGKGLVCVKHGG